MVEVHERSLDAVIAEALAADDATEAAGVAAEASAEASESVADEVEPAFVEPLVFDESFEGRLGPGAGLLRLLGDAPARGVVTVRVAARGVTGTVVLHDDEGRTLATVPLKAGKASTGPVKVGAGAIYVLIERVAGAGAVAVSADFHRPALARR